MKKYDVSILASATLRFWKEIEAESENEAKELFLKVLRKSLEGEDLDYNIQEMPVKGHDYSDEDVEIS